MDGLAIALWAVYNTTSATEAIVRCINLRGDADSTGAIAGQIAGAYYGLGSVDPGLVAAVQRWDGGGDIAIRGALLWYLGGANEAT